MNDTKLRGFSHYIARRVSLIMGANANRYDTPDYSAFLTRSYAPTDKHGVAINYFTTNKVPPGVLRMNVLIIRSSYEKKFIFIANLIDGTNWCRGMYKENQRWNQALGRYEVSDTWKEYSLLQGYNTKLDVIPAPLLRKLFRDDMAYHDRCVRVDTIAATLPIAKALPFDVPAKTAGTIVRRATHAGDDDDGSFKPIERVESVNELVKWTTGKDSRFTRAAFTRLIGHLGYENIGQAASTILILEQAISDSSKYDVLDTLIENKMYMQATYNGAYIPRAIKFIGTKKFINMLNGQTGLDNNRYRYGNIRGTGDASWYLVEYIGDIGSMLNDIGDSFPVKDVIGKYQTLKELHDKLVPARRLVKDANIKFTFDKRLTEVVDGINGITFPVDSTMVETWGAEQHHCIGTYGGRMHNQTFILVQFVTEDELSHAQISYSERGWGTNQHYTAYNRRPCEANKKLEAKLLDKLGAIKVEQGEFLVKGEVESLSTEQIIERLTATPVAA